MKIIFFATSEFACPILEKLIKEGEKVLAVVTQPDKPRGRHLSVGEPPVKVLSKKLKLNVLQPDDIRDQQFIKKLKSMSADVFVVVSFGKILKKEILSLPKKICINIHASLLPKYRGAAPINWAIVEGEKKTGITIMKMNEAMDEGDIILQKDTVIDEGDTSISVGKRLSLLGASALVEVLELLKKKRIKFVVQDSKKAIYAPKLEKSDGLIIWNSPAEKIYNKIRGLIPWPGSFTYFNGRLLKIYGAIVVPSTSIERAKPATIVKVTGEGILVATGKNNLLIKELQMEGKRRMSAGEFIVGHQLKAGQRFSEKSVA